MAGKQVEEAEGELGEGNEAGDEKGGRKKRQTKSKVKKPKSKGARNRETLKKSKSMSPKAKAEPKSKKARSNLSKGKSSANLGAKSVDGKGGEILETPPSRASTCPDRSRTKRKAEVPEDIQDGTVPHKKTFARRYRPATQIGGATWDALQSAFVSVVATRIHAPSVMEALSCSN